MSLRPRTMISYDVDPSLHTAPPAPIELDDGFGRPTSDPAPDPAPQRQAPGDKEGLGLGGEKSPF